MLVFTPAVAGKDLDDPACDDPVVDAHPAPAAAVFAHGRSRLDAAVERDEAETGSPSAQVRIGCAVSACN
jgi:hypothetical protein